mmetsp:Transcript_13072/g.54754  ORF Transcript_13072/g.54754 Transcript_13072/m.54754 type:complete len:249 (-) Transcript_13072:2446-3192(-)
MLDHDLAVALDSDQGYADGSLPGNGVPHGHCRQASLHPLRARVEVAHRRASRLEPADLVEQERPAPIDGARGHCLSARRDVPRFVPVGRTQRLGRQPELARRVVERILQEEHARQVAGGTRVRVGGAVGARHLPVEFPVWAAVGGVVAEQDVKWRAVGRVGEGALQHRDLHLHGLQHTALCKSELVFHAVRASAPQRGHVVTQLHLHTDGSPESVGRHRSCAGDGVIASDLAAVGSPDAAHRRADLRG